MTYIQKILEKHPEASSWHQDLPWFSLGHLIAAQQTKEKQDFKTNAQKAAIFTDNIPRLHWLLYQPQAEAANALDAARTSNSENEDTTLLTDVAASPVIQTSSLINQEAKDFSTDEFSSSQDFDSHSQSVPHLSEVPEQAEEATDELATIESGLSQPSLSPSLAAAAESFKNDVPTDDNLPFETDYQHTIDYFASQGIRLEGEPAQDDRFGQQLKTFTSWLRQMKPLPNTQELNRDLLVETHAAHSLQKGEVVTEPMVDVLLKQGKKQQAIQVLEKLRLLHPEKSLYFAARCQQIKFSE